MTYSNSGFIAIIMLFLQHVYTIALHVRLKKRITKKSFDHRLFTRNAYNDDAS